MRLSRREFEVLVTMAADPSKVFSRDELARTVWGSSPVGGRTIDSHVTRLRHRLNDAGGQFIENAWGQGWALTPRDDPAA